MRAESSDANFLAWARRRRDEWKGSINVFPLMAGQGNEQSDDHPYIAGAGPYTVIFDAFISRDFQDSDLW
jgi:hypothetical protein